MDGIIKNSCLSEKGRVSADVFWLATIRSDVRVEDREDSSHDWVQCRFKLPEKRRDLLDDPKFKERGMRELFCGFPKSGNIVTDQIDRNMIDKPCAILDNCRYLSAVGEKGLFPLRNYRMKTLAEMVAHMGGLCGKLKNIAPVYNWLPINMKTTSSLLDHLSKNPGSIVDMFATKHRNPIIVFLVYTINGLMLFSADKNGAKMGELNLYKDGWWWMDWSYFEGGDGAPDRSQTVQFTVKCSTVTTRTWTVNDKGEFNAV